METVIRRLRRSAPAIALLLLPAGCASLEPDPQACVAGLTPERVTHLMEWAGDQMGVGGAVGPPAIRCAPEEAMAEMYRWAGSDAEKHLGFYDRWFAVVYLNDGQSYPDGEHILVHELVHHLQWTHGLGMNAREREVQAEMVHERWMAAR